MADFTGVQAKVNGLVDELGTQEDAEKELRNLARQRFGLDESIELPLERVRPSFGELLDVLIAPSGRGSLFPSVLWERFFPQLAAQGAVESPILLMPSWYGEVP
ncbi:MAG: hypothetical protein HC919_06255 [Oscillatoriales cyanobacterium SM2_2_1]|nr:hypothetical protein [Oscillatoriales cyanobacterium SM2_2_1]